MEQYGFREEFRLDLEEEFSDLELGRVITEHKERYILQTGSGEVEAEVLGNLRYTATVRADFPAVGDWVAFMRYQGSSAIIHKILPRFSTLERKAIGKSGEKQIIATNIDVALIMLGCDRDFNINRIERYLAICETASVIPKIVLTKIDLVSKDHLSNLLSEIERRVKGIPVYPVSNENRAGFDELTRQIEKGKTYCLLGSSGVGKSTLTNNLSSSDHMKTGTTSSSTSKGRHITSHRELVLLANGGLLIDNPGMREVGIADAGPETDTIEDFNRIAEGCYYKDCTHVHEAGCAIIEAVEKGLIDRDSYENYLKMVREQTHFEMSESDKRRRDKRFGKMVKRMKKDKDDGKI